MVIQGYDRINWEDLPSQNTPINAENLNHMEDGIENLYAAIGDIDLDAIAADIAEVKEEVENFQPGVELTQEEYDDLTEEEKNNGTIYYIKDGDASAITAADAHYDNSTSGLTATNVQSAVDEVDWILDAAVGLLNPLARYELNTEQLIGTWDGKKLFRKIFQLTVTSSGTSLQTIDIITSKIVYWIPMCRASNDTLDLHYYVDGTDRFRVWLTKYNDTQTRANIGIGSTYPILNATVTLMIYYTE